MTGMVCSCEGWQPDVLRYRRPHGGRTAHVFLILLAGGTMYSAYCGADSISVANDIGMLTLQSRSNHFYIMHAFSTFDIIVDELSCAY